MVCVVNFFEQLAYSWAQHRSRCTQQSGVYSLPRRQSSSLKLATVKKKSQLNLN